MSPQKPRKNSIQRMFEKEIKGKNPKDYVRLVVIKAGALPKVIMKNSSFLYCPDIYLSSKALMHIYERHREALETVIISNAYSLLCYPEVIYENRLPHSKKTTKRGDILFVKYFPKIDVTLTASLELLTEGHNIGYHVATMFIVNRQN